MFGLASRRQRARTRSVLLAALFFFHCTRSVTAQSPALALTGVTIVNAEDGSLTKNQAILIGNGRVLALGPNGHVDIPVDAKVVNASGKYLIPGLWDAHVHLSYLGPCSLAAFVANGVLKVRDLGAQLDQVNAWRDDIRQDGLPGPTIFTAGPNLESAGWMVRAHTILPAESLLWKLGPRRVVSSAEDAKVAVQELSRLHVDLIKFRNLEPQEFYAVAAEAQRVHLPLAGHAPKIDPVDAARAGLRSFEHAETLSLALGNRSEDERLKTLQGVARAGSFLTPTLVTFRASHMTTDKQEAEVIAGTGAHNPLRAMVSSETLKIWRIADGLKKFDEPADWNALYQRQLDDTRLANQAGVRLLAGTDIGSLPGLYPGDSLHRELQLLVRNAGLTPSQALKAATVNPSLFFSAKSSHKLIEIGAPADLLLLDRNPLDDIANARSINAVIQAGHFLSHEVLKQKLRQSEQDLAGSKGCAAL